MGSAGYLLLALLCVVVGALAAVVATVCFERGPRSGRAREATARAEIGEHQRAMEVELAARELDAGRRETQELLERLRATLERVERSRAEDHGALAARVVDLAGVTAELAATFRSSPARGAWGEFHLRRVVEIAGMERWCDFSEQQSVNGLDGRLRPDLVVHLPGGRDVVIDSKAPLDAYRAAQDATDEPSRVAARCAVARAVRQRVSELADRRYWEQLPRTLDFVVLFLPFEAVLSAALEGDPQLLEAAASDRVVLATPATLLALLKAVAYGWREEELARSASEIRTIGGELYQRLGVVLRHGADLGTSLASTVESYNRLVGSFESRLLPSARRLHEAGLGSDPPVPVRAVERVPRAPNRHKALQEEPERPA